MSSSILPLLLLLTASLMFSPQNSLAKLIFPIIGPVNYIFLAFTLAIPFSLLFYYIKFRRFPKFKKSEIPYILLAGLFSGIASMVFFFALNYTEVKNAGFVSSVSRNVVNFFMARKFLDERFNITFVFGASIAVLGSILITTNGLVSPPSIGDFMILFAIIADSIRNTVTKKHFVEKSPEEGMLIQTVGAGLTIFLVLLPFFSPNSMKFSPLPIFTIIYTATIGAVIGKTLFLTALEKIGLSRVSLIFSVFQPINISIFAYLILRESFTKFDLIGGLFALLGIVIINWAKIRKTVNGKIKII